MDQAEYNAKLLTELGSVTSDPYKFVMFAFPWGSGELAGFQGPDAWQKDILQAIRDRALNLNEVIRVAVTSGHGIGKSALVAWLILWAISTYPDTRGVVTANTDGQLRTKTWPELAKWHRLFIAKHIFELTATRLHVKDPAHELTWRIDLVPWSERNTEAFAGLHNQGNRILLLFDEASSIPPLIWDTAEGALTDKDTQIIWAAFGNPTRNTGSFRECFGRFRHRWLTRQIDSRTAAMSNKAQLQNWVDDYGEDSDFVRIRVRGIFPRASATQLFDDELVREAQERQLEVDHGAPLVMGVDVARFGSDKSVIRFRRGRDARSIKPLKFRDLDTHQFSSRVIEQFEEHPETVAIFIDGAGVGGGVVDRVKALIGERRRDVTVFEVQSGASAEAKRDFANKIAECWSRMHEWMKIGAIDQDPELREDLTCRDYGYTDSVQLRLERKEDMTKRGLSSPDDGDALALTFAERVPRRDISKPKTKPQAGTFISAGNEGSWMT